MTKTPEIIKRAAAILGVSPPDFMKIEAEGLARRIVERHEAREKRAKYFTSMCYDCNKWPCTCR